MAGLLNGVLSSKPKSELVTVVSEVLIVHADKASDRPGARPRNRVVVVAEGVKRHVETERRYQPRPPRAKRREVVIVAERVSGVVNDAQ